MVCRLLSAMAALLALVATQAGAVPVLQLGPDPADSSASYDPGNQTWFFGGTGSGFSFNAYNLGPDLTAYIVLSSVPMLNTDVFDVTMSDNSGALSLYDSGYGTPPFEDPNSLAPHGIYDTWSEIYQITFDGPSGTVANTKPGMSGDTATGYTETVTVTINSVDPAVTGIHVDMFTAAFDAEKAKDIVTDFAPFSHDGQYAVVPAPAALWLFGSGLLAITGFASRRTG